MRLYSNAFIKIIDVFSICMESDKSAETLQDHFQINTLQFCSRLKHFVLLMCISEMKVADLIAPALSRALINKAIFLDYHFIVNSN